MQPQEQVRTTALTRTTSLYDVYPLTVRQSVNNNDSFLLRPSLSRTRSQHLVPADDLLRPADFLQSSRSVGAGLVADATTSGHVDKVRCPLSVSLCLYV